VCPGDLFFLLASAGQIASGCPRVHFHPRAERFVKIDGLEPHDFLRSHFLHTECRFTSAGQIRMNGAATTSARDGVQVAHQHGLPSPGAPSSQDVPDGQKSPIITPSTIQSGQRWPGNSPRIRAIFSAEFRMLAEGMRRPSAIPPPPSHRLVMNP